MDVIVGIDEVGRGCWAGPLVAAAVVLLEPIAGLNDSKLLSSKRRTILSELIKLKAVYGVGWVSALEVDQLGLTAATALAMQKALLQIDTDYDEIIIDGNYNFLHDQGQTFRNARVKALVGADKLIAAVSAASIMVKVARDQFMAEQAFAFPHYGFEKHVGYGTARHLAALKEFGTCEIHRLSYKPIRAIRI